MIKTTAEVITILEGSMKLDLYDIEHELLEQVTLNRHDTIILFDGGHGLTMQEDCQFLEEKQRPYDQENDKYHF